jgi:hypothetical protein
MKIRIWAAVAASIVASGCQTAANQGQKQWVQIQAGDVFDVADAKCRLWSQQFQTGVYAQGTPGFVLGAQLGNAIGNAIRMQEAYTNCMTIAGWKQVPVIKPKKKMG